MTRFDSSTPTPSSTTLVRTGVGVALGKVRYELSFQEQLRALNSPTLGRAGVTGSLPAGRGGPEPLGSSLTGRPVFEEVRSHAAPLGDAQVSRNPTQTPSEAMSENREVRQKEGGNEVTRDAAPFDLAWSEPLVRVLSAPALTAVQRSQPASASVIDRIASLLVRKVGLGPTSVHLEFGAGELAEGNLLVQATDDGLEIALQTPAGVDAAALGAALTKRLLGKGIRISRIEVT